MLSNRWLTFRELMAYLKIGRSKLYKLLQEGTIPASRIGISWRIDREEVDAWMKTQRAIPTRDDLDGEPPLEPEVLEMHSTAGRVDPSAEPKTE